MPHALSLTASLGGIRQFNTSTNPGDALVQPQWSQTHDFLPVCSGLEGTPRPAPQLREPTARCCGSCCHGFWTKARLATHPRLLQLVGEWQLAEKVPKRSVTIGSHLNANSCAPVRLSTVIPQRIVARANLSSLLRLKDFQGHCCHELVKLRSPIHEIRAGRSSLQESSMGRKSDGTRSRKSQSRLL